MHLKSHCSCENDYFLIIIIYFFSFFYSLKLKSLEQELLRIENPTLADVDRILVKFQQQVSALH